VPLIVALLALPLLGAAAPSDPLASQQWHLTKVGAAVAWDGGRGGGVVVAVIDTGVDLDHPDLRDRLVQGIDLVDEGTPPDDPQGHGTLVAGIIAADADNGQGVAGIAPRARIMPVRVLDDEGRGTPATVAAGIRWAADHGASVINLSLAEAVVHDGAGIGRRGAEGLVDVQVEQAIQAAAKAGALVVAAAGNDGRDAVPYRDSLPVLVVGATDRTDHIWSRSNRGAQVLFAPGVEILSTWNKGRYAKVDGTSFATSIVAAGAAILRGQDLSAGQTRARLVGSAVQVGSGLGRIDLAAAVTGVPAAETPQSPVEPVKPIASAAGANPLAIQAPTPSPTWEPVFSVQPPPALPPLPVPSAPVPSMGPSVIALHRPVAWQAPVMIAGAVLLIAAAGIWIVNGLRSGRR
jgi:subtilisin family serine protease